MLTVDTTSATRYARNGADWGRGVFFTFFSSSQSDIEVISQQENAPFSKLIWTIAAKVIRGIVNNAVNIRNGKYNPDGGYNKVIPAQHDELLNHLVTVKGQSKGAKGALKAHSDGSAGSSVLCKKCSINQHLKVQQLAAFSPTNPSYFDQEIEEYRLHLERAYELCSVCERSLKLRLSQQQGWIVGLYQKELEVRSLQGQEAPGCWRRALSQVLSQVLVVGLPPWCLQCLELGLLPLPLGLLLAHGHLLGPSTLDPFLSSDLSLLLGILLQWEGLVCVVVALGMAGAIVACHARRRPDILCLVLWLATAAHALLLQWQSIREHLGQDDLSLGRMVVLGLTLTVNALATFAPREASLWDVRLHRAQTGSRSSLVQQRSSGSSERLLAPPPPRSSSSSSASQVLLLMSSSAPPPPPPPLLLSSSSCSCSSSLSSPGGGGGGADDDDDGLESSLRRLHIGGAITRDRRSRNRSPWGGAAACCSLRRRVTQTSWVAGGYWGALGGGRQLQPVAWTPAPPPPAPSPAPSRCSSQSSGFHSRRSSASPPAPAAAWCVSRGGCAWTQPAPRRATKCSASICSSNSSGSSSSSSSDCNCNCKVARGRGVLSVPNSSSGSSSRRSAAERRQRVEGGGGGWRSSSSSSSPWVVAVCCVSLLLNVVGFCGFLCGNRALLLN